MIGSSKYGQNRPLLPAMWHPPSRNAPKTDFFIQNTREDVLDKSIISFEKAMINAQNRRNARKQEEKVIKSVEKKFKADVVLKDEDEDESELLVSLILEKVKAGAHSLCDGEFPTKMCYKNIMNLIFAFLNSAKEKQSKDDLANFVKIDILPYYRHVLADADGHVARMVNSVFEQTDKKCLTIASLHHWARENEEYKNHFAKKEPEMDLSDEALSKLVFDALKPLYHKNNGKVYIYDEDTCLWVLSERESFREHIYTTLKNHIYAIKDEEERDKAIEELKTTPRQTRILTRLWSKIICNASDKFIDEHLDNHKSVFPIADCKVVDLKTGEVRDRRKDDYFTKTSTRTLLDSPDVPFVREYLSEVLNTTNDAYVDFVLSVIGYMLSGENNMKHFYILYGEANTGKSLFLHIINSIFEGFGGVVNDRIFKQSRNESVHNAEIFSLIGKRSGVVSELGEKEKFNEQLMKKISGGDDIEIRGCGSKENVLVNLNCVLMMALNEIPQFTEKAFIERMRVIRFTRRFENNPVRRDAILSKIDDFFTVAVRYARRFYNAGLTFETVDEVLASTKSVADDKDSFKGWWDEDLFVIDEEYKGKIIKENNIQNPSEWRTKKTEVYNSYTNWCETNGAEAMGRTKFYARFSSEFKLPDYRDKWWRGIERASMKM
jgi:P4 family phage/plasmid primase-like protien